MLGIPGLAHVQDDRQPQAGSQIELLLRVGYDIAAGWYQGTVKDHMGYWQVSSDANGQTLVGFLRPATGSGPGAMRMNALGG